MSSFGAVMKEEVARLAKKAVRGDTQKLHSTSTAHRRHIAALRRQLDATQRDLAALKRFVAKTSKSAVSIEQPDALGAKVRISTKGLKSLRAKLGISQSDLGKLIDVSAQTIYNWERHGVSSRKGHREKLAALRGLGKREVNERLKALQTPANKQAATKRRRRRASAK